MLSTRLSNQAVKRNAHRALIPLMVGILSALLVLSTLFGGSPEEILGALPAIMLAVALAFGRYPGEELIIKLTGRRTRRPLRSALSAILPLSVAPATWLARGSHLIAFSLAKRPPPLRLLPQI